MSTAHCCALLCAHCRLLPLIIVDLAPGTFTTVICTSDQPIKPSDPHAGELSEGKNHLGTLRIPHLVSKLDDKFARQNGNAEGRVDHQSSVKPHSTSGIVVGIDQRRDRIWEELNFAVVYRCEVLFVNHHGS